MFRIPRSLSLVFVACVVAALFAFGIPPSRTFAATLCVGGSGCYSTIQAAVDAAAAGDTVMVNPGTYAEQVTISTPLTLEGAGAGSSIIDATSTSPSHGITVNGASGTTITGFTVENANNEGILVNKSSDVTITANTVQNNDKGLQINAANPLQSSCAGALPFDQDDCGEGIHLDGVSKSMVSDNIVQNNAGGILLTDDLAANHDNTIDGNTVKNNVYDCGITVPSHPSKFIPPTSPDSQPTFVPGFGVYNNMISNNVVSGNGVSGPGGAGIGLFAFAPGSRVSDNTVEGNVILSNGLAGVAFHAHAPGLNMDNNKIMNNLIGTNNLTPGDAGDMQTTGILMFSAFDPVNGTVISGNEIWANYYGIWTSGINGNKLSSPNNSISATIPYFSEPQSALPPGA